MSVFDGGGVYNNSGRFRRDLADIPPVRPCGNDGGEAKAEDILKQLVGKITGKNTDSDVLLIIALIFLLSAEGADKKLLLALGYILL